ncbi:glycosyltransferase family 2 protein [Xanthomarina sp. F2636L]|uniref:glycosyltransferase family 2 protein n=1 Tax=Xanthomarina sp. F2636L TaxID=2996018 RepID=UPI00225E426E|nr:glycosyltransferase family 2 protein [Xanthomarina sp. F2636L]MCX7549744.1 glycosyltransferase family 2 protein [Xanthomarina sp. F2636L]
MQNPLISILTPFKNTNKFLYDCIESIQNQTYTNWELLIIDDSSTDNSYQIVHEFTKHDKRIKLFKNPGEGIIEALRFALKKSSGIYITRMDSDDIMTPNKLEALLNNLQKHGKKHLATGLVSYFSEDGINDGYRNYETWLNQLTRTGNNYSEIYKECVIPSPCWMVHKNDLFAADAFNPNDYPEDYDLAFRFYKQQLKVIPCNQVLHHWRDYSTRTSRTHEHYAQNYFLEIKLKYFLELDFDTSKQLVIWGAGFKGKTIAKLLIERQVDFIWICNNPKKIGKHIYGQELYSYTYLTELKQTQCIITVANKQSQKTIRSFFENKNKIATTDYFFFC